MPSDLKNLISQLLVVGFRVTPATLKPLKKISPSLFPKIISYLKINQNKGNTLTPELLQEIIESIDGSSETKENKVDEKRTQVTQETLTNKAESEQIIVSKHLFSSSIGSLKNKLNSSILGSLKNIFWHLAKYI